MNGDFSPSDPRELTEDLIRLLSVEPVAPDLFRGPTIGVPVTRVFGGQILAQAVTAACRTVDDDRALHSLHGHFLRAGDALLDTTYQVARNRDGKSFSSRGVVAFQNARPIFTLSCSFHRKEAGLEHQSEMPRVDPPEALEDSVEAARRYRDLITPAQQAMLVRPRAIEIRPLDPALRFNQNARPARQGHWFRVASPLPNDRALHQALLAYASDSMLLSVASLPHGLSWARGDLQQASIDHALWMRSDIRMDRWHLYLQDSPWSGAGRGFTRGEIYTREGALIATVSQEGIMRPRTARRA